MKVIKYFSKKTLIPNVNHRVRLPAVCLAAVLGLVSALSVQATVLDSFLGAKTGWTDTLNGGSVVQTPPEFIISTPASSGVLTYSTKTSSAFSVAPGNTLEFKVNVDATSGNAQTILGWVPTGGTLANSGYSVAVSGTSFIINKNGSPVFTGPAITNISSAVLSLRLTGSGGSVTVLARVYNKIPVGLAGLLNTVQFEQTFVDGSGLLTSGNAALGVKNTAGVASASYSFLQVFNTTSFVLDAFTGSSIDPKWTVLKSGASTYYSATESSNGLELKAEPGVAKYTLVYCNNQTFQLSEGGQVEFQCDVTDNSLAAYGGYASIGYAPSSAATSLAKTVQYFVASDNITPTPNITSGKAFQQYSGAAPDGIQSPAAPPGGRFTVTMSAETNLAGSVNVRVEYRIEDLSKTDPNDPLRLVYQNEWVDTTNTDLGLNEDSLGNVAPFVNGQGIFAINAFNYSANQADIRFQNAVVRQTQPPPQPPILANIAPAFTANYLPASTSVSFDVSDTANLSLNAMSVTLNGVTYANGSGLVTITQPGGPTTAHFVLAGALVAHLNYVGSIQATNAGGLVAVSGVQFDTFSASDYVVESEEYNFTTDGVTGGTFLDNPTILLFPNSDPSSSYSGVNGILHMDYNNIHYTNDSVAWGDADHYFRGDFTRTATCGDFQRAKYTAVPGSSEAEVDGIYDNDWYNYTHHNYPVGTFNVYLRQASYAFEGWLVTFERVTGATTFSQNNTVLGMFAAQDSGFSLFENVPLTDAIGNPMVLRLTSASDTFQINNRVTGQTGTSLQQNYFIFAPTTVVGTLGPVVSMGFPVRNSTLNSASPVVSAEIANRDTSVNVGSIDLRINGISTGATPAATAHGATVSFALPSPLPVPGSTVTNTVIYQDIPGTFYTNTWTWKITYAFFNPAYSQPLGSMKNTGFDVRTTVQLASSALGDGVGTARTLLLQPPVYAVDYASTNIATTTVNWGINPTQMAGGDDPFPGLCATTAFPNYFACEIFAYLHLKSGQNTILVNSDDDMGMYTGTSLRDDSVALLETTGVVNDQAVTFNVGSEALYPFHVIFQENGGAAYLRLRLVSGGTTNLLGSQGEVFYPFMVQSSSSPKGPWTADPIANASLNLTSAPVPCDGTGSALTQTLTGGSTTFTLPTAPKYYRINGPRPTKITNFHKTVGPPATLSITFTGQ